MEPLATATGRALLGGFADVDRSTCADFIDRLDVMSAFEFFKQYKSDTFAMMQVAPGKRVADVGCGTGDDARALAERVGPGGAVVGFDVSEAMIDEARRRHAEGGAQLRFVRAPADGLGVADATFDALRADRVLLHVPDPAAAVREAVRVVRPGGRIVISEPDMASVWTATRLPEAGEAILRAVALSVAHPLVARDLVDLFLEAGLEHLHLELRPLVINDPEPGERILNFSAVAERLVVEGRLSTDAAQQWLAELAERKRTGRFLGGMTIFIVAASKPV